VGALGGLGTGGPGPDEPGRRGGWPRVLRKRLWAVGVDWGLEGGRGGVPGVHGRRGGENPLSEKKP